MTSGDETGSGTGTPGTPEDELEQELAAARQRIAVLEEQVDALSSAPQDAQVAAALRAALAQIGATAVLTAPMEHASWQAPILRTALEVLGATAATLYEVDEATQELVFAVALGEHAAALQGERLPLGAGLAGWVAMTGQPLAASNLEQDPRWAREVGYRVGYTPQAMVAVPLLGPAGVVGVMQLMDKSSGEPFSAADMTTLTLFAQPAAVAITQSQALHSLTALVRLALAGTDAPPELLAQTEQVVARAEGSAAYRGTQELARLVGEVAASGDTGRQLAADVLGAVHRYAASRRVW